MSGEELQEGDLVVWEPSTLPPYEIFLVVRMAGGQVHLLSSVTKDVFTTGPLDSRFRTVARQ